MIPSNFVWNGEGQWYGGFQDEFVAGVILMFKILNLRLYGPKAIEFSANFFMWFVLVLFFMVVIVLMMNEFLTIFRLNILCNKFFC